MMGRHGRGIPLVEIFLVVAIIAALVAVLLPIVGSVVESGPTRQPVPWRFRFVSDAAPQGIQGVTVRCLDSQYPRHLATRPGDYRHTDSIVSDSEGVAQGQVIFFGAPRAGDGDGGKDAWTDWGKDRTWTFVFTHPDYQEQTLTVVSGTLLETGKKPVTIRLLPRASASQPIQAVSRPVP